ncbi:MAG TPA: dihydrofolate reductase family protein [Polyangiaceae bacterium]|nr:dihydrofolate reductase family protein [Polyangiaceae bacterium]
MPTETARASRPRGSVFIAVSADGFIARENGAIDWLSAVQLEGEDYGYKEFFDSVDTLVIGRGTYDTVLGFEDWPYGDKRCVVVTHRPPAAQRRTEEFFTGTPLELVERLAREGARRLYIDGGQLIRSFLEAELVDDLVLSVVPVLLGAGIPLFGGVAREQRLSLSESRSWPTGLVQLRYRVGHD